MKKEEQGKKIFSRYSFLFLLVYITLFAWNYGSSFGEGGPGGRNINVIPLETISRIFEYGSIETIFRIIIGNVLLFVPFGFLFPLFLQGFQRNNKPIRIFPIIFAGFYTSFMIELTQFAFTKRVSNVDDLILNTLGTVIGVILYRIYDRMKRE